MAEVLPNDVDTAEILTPRCGSFVDVSADENACPAVQELVRRNMILGYPDGTMRPDYGIRRAELAKLLVLSLGAHPDPKGPLPFSDAIGHWAAEQGYLQTAVAMRMIQGYTDGTFRPDSFVTRAELLTMAAASHSLAFGGPCHYQDVDRSAWYADQVAEACAAGLIGPDAPIGLWAGDELQPNRHATRLEAVTLLSNLLQQLA